MSLITTKLIQFSLKSGQLCHQPTTVTKTKSCYLGDKHYKLLSLMQLKEPLKHQHFSCSTEQTKGNEHRDRFLTLTIYLNSPKTWSHYMNHVTHKIPQHWFFTNPNWQPLRVEQQSDIWVWRQKDGPSHMPQVPNTKVWCKHHSSLLHFLKKWLSSR